MNRKLLALGLCAVVGCSESVDGSENPDAAVPRDAATSADMATAADAATSADMATATDASADAAADAASDDLTGLVINEVALAGDDYIELYNAGSSAISLAGYSVTDRASEGGPDLDADALFAFPSSLSIAAGEYFLIAANVDVPREGVQTDCLDGVTGDCFEVGFGLSAGDGDGVFVVDGELNVVLSVEVAGGLVNATTSYSTLPNGGTTYAVSARTPGAANLPVPTP